MTTTFKITDSRRDKNVSIVTFSAPIVKMNDTSGGLYCFPAFSKPTSETSVSFAKFTKEDVVAKLLSKGFVQGE